MPRNRIGEESDARFTRGTKRFFPVTASKFFSYAFPLILGHGTRPADVSRYDWRLYISEPGQKCCLPTARNERRGNKIYFLSRTCTEGGAPNWKNAVLYRFRAQYPIFYLFTFLITGVLISLAKETCVPRARRKTARECLSRFNFSARPKLETLRANDGQSFHVRGSFFQDLCQWDARRGS